MHHDSLMQLVSDFPASSGGSWGEGGKKKDEAAVSKDVLIRVYLTRRDHRATISIDCT